MPPRSGPGERPDDAPQPLPPQPAEPDGKHCSFSTNPVNFKHPNAPLDCLAPATLLAGIVHDE
jgi:hypothetical protein